jgi:hypothetical protein
VLDPLGWAEVEVLAGPQLQEEPAKNLLPAFVSFDQRRQQLVLLVPAGLFLGPYRRFGGQATDQGKDPPRITKQVPQIEVVEPLKVSLEKLAAIG